jgi:hypothetical protein
MLSGRVPHGHAYTRTIISDARGRAISEHWNIHGAGHAWSGGSPVPAVPTPIREDRMPQGRCCPTYNFSVNINDGVVTHPNLVKFSGHVGRSGAVRASVTVHDKYASGSRETRAAGPGAATQKVGAARDIGPRNEATRTACVGNKRLGVRRHWIDQSRALMVTHRPSLKRKITGRPAPSQTACSLVYGP